MQNKIEMNNRRPASFKWGIGVLIFFTLMSYLYAYLGTVSYKFEENDPQFNVTAYLITAIFAAISAVGLIRSKYWSKWLTVLTLSSVNIGGIVSGVQLFMYDKAFIYNLIQPVVLSIPIFYLAFCIGWGVPSKSYFENVKMHNKKLQRTNR